MVEEEGSTVAEVAAMAVDAVKDVVRTTLATLRLWKIVSKETTFKGGEHHTRGTGTDDKDRVLAIAMAAERTQSDRKGTVGFPC